MLDWYSEVVRAKGERQNTGALFLLQLQAYLAPKKGFIKEPNQFYNALSKKNKRAREKKKIKSMPFKSWAVSGK